MFQLVRTYRAIADTARVAYQPRVFGEVQPDGSWDGWLVFFPVLPGAVIATHRETTQRSFADLVSWSATIGPAYLEGALERAQRIQLESGRSARLAELTVLEREAVEDRVALETAAAQARAEADAAAHAAAVHETAAAAAIAQARERIDEARALERALLGDELATDRSAHRSQAADRRSSRKKPRTRANAKSRKRRAVRRSRKAVRQVLSREL